MSAPASPTERSSGIWRRWLPAWALLWSARLAAAGAVSQPLAAALGLGEHTDRALFEPGGLMLLEVLRLRAERIVSALGASTLLLFGAWALLVVVTTCSVALLDRDTASGPAAPWWRAAGRALPRVLGLGGVAVGVTLVCGVVLLLGTLAARSALPPSAPPVAGGLVLLGGVVLGGVLIALGGIAFDLMRAHLVRGAPTLQAAWREAWLSFSRSTARLLVARATVAAASLSVVGVAAWVAQHQDLARDAAGPLIVVSVGHRLAGALLAGIQITWLALVLRACDPRDGAQASPRAQP